MDCIKVGQLIYHLRKEKAMTQKQLADALFISDRTISKWERGLGCPDVSLLGALSTVLGVHIEKLLSGYLDPNETNGGNMKKLKFYVCSGCGNTLTATGEAEISCCGRKLSPLAATPAEVAHQPAVEVIEDDFYITFTHDMTKEHYISFVAIVTFNKVLFVKLYPEQNPEARFPKMRGGTLYFYCNQHGLQTHKL